MATGKITKRGKGWQIDISMGSIDGVRKRKRWMSKATTKAEATSEMNNELYKLNRQTRNGEVVDNEYLLSDLTNQWFEHIAVTIVNSKTNSGYQNDIKRIAQYLPSNIVISGLTPQVIDQVLAEMTEKYSHDSINKGLTRLRTMIDYGVSRSILFDNPIAAVKLLPKKRMFFKRALTVEEAKELIKVAPKRWSIIWRFILSTGLRRQELIELTWSNVDLANKLIRVLPTDKWKPKTKDSIRTIPISDKLVADLKSLDREAEHVFVSSQGNQLKHNLIRELRGHMHNAFCSLYGLTYGKRLNKKEKAEYDKYADKIEADLKQINIHALRYTFCTHLISSGVDIKTVQKLMGHNNPEVTLRVYAQYCHGNAESAIDKLPW